MAIRAAINGFGRIGRLVLRAAHELDRDEIEIVAVNDLGDAESNAHLLQFDSVHGRFPGAVSLSNGTLDLSGRTVEVLREKDPAALPWKEMDVDLVFECSGAFRTREAAGKHLDAGAQRVLISAPAKGKGADLTVVYGVNHKALTRDHVIVSNASCTTNCVAPLAHVLHQAFGIEHAYMLTAHGYTGSQQLVDGLHKDLRRARAAAVNMIPTSTGAAEAVGDVLPELEGRIVGSALRVPLPNISIVYLTFQAGRTLSTDGVHDAMRAAASGELEGVLDVSDRPLVSSDYNHNPYSAVLDSESTMVVGPQMATVAGWYDNEWAFAIRMLDTGQEMARFIAN